MASASGCQPQTAEEFWLPEELKAATSCQYLPSLATKHNPARFLFLQDRLAGLLDHQLVPTIFMNTLPKEERLCGIKLISGLYQSGSSFLCYPYKISWQLQENAEISGAKVLFSVSKKRFKRAVDRNRIKRQMRESYRLQKQQLFLPAETPAKSMIFSVTYIGKELSQSELMLRKMQKALQQLAEKLV